jgi:hypothetical protein
MGNSAVTSLLEDAYLVLQYAVRAGRLPDDSLPNAIREVETSMGAGGLASLVALSNAMNGAVTAIAPITLVDLRAGRSPFDKDHSGSSRKLQDCLCGLTVLLAAFIAFYSFSVQRKEGALREYQEIRAAKIPEKIDALYRLVQQEEVRTRKDPRYEQYQRSLNEIQGLDARDQAALNLLAEQSLATGWPFQDEVRAVMSWIDRDPRTVRRRPVSQRASMLWFLSRRTRCTTRLATTSTGWSRWLRGAMAAEISLRFFLSWANSVASTMARKRAPKALGAPSAKSFRAAKAQQGCPARYPSRA